MNEIDYLIVNKPLYIYIYLNSSLNTIKFVGYDKMNCNLFEINSKLNKNYWVYGISSPNRKNITTSLLIKQTNKQIVKYYCNFDLGIYECQFYKSKEFIGKTKRAFFSAWKIYNNAGNLIGKVKGVPFSFNFNRNFYTNNSEKLFSIKKCKSKVLNKTKIQQNVKNLNWLYKITPEKNIDLRFLLLWASEFTAGVFDNDTYEG